MYQIEDWLNELEGPPLDPLEVARRKGYTEGYLACEENRKRDAEYLEQLVEGEPLIDLLRKGEPLDQDDAVRVWHLMHYRLKTIPEGGTLHVLYDKLARELFRGERCAVCGRYKNSGCTTEC